MNRKHSSRRRRGIALIWTILTLFVLIGFVGFGTDVGWMVLSAQQLQTTADASALAAAQLVKVDQPGARQAAADLALLNKAAGDPVTLNLNDVANDPAGDIVIGRYDQDNLTFTPQTSGANAVKVVARRIEGGTNGGVGLFFAKAFGVDTVDVERYAIAINGGGTGAGMIVLCQTSVPDGEAPPPPGATCECALELQGTSSGITVSGGAVQVNSNAACATCNNGNPILDAPQVNVSGGDCFGADVVSGNTTTGTPPIPDPLANIPEPSAPANAPAPTGPNGDRRYYPGRYPSGLNIANNVVAHLDPGLYYIENGMDMRGSISGNGVMLFIKSGSIQFRTGSSAANLTPMNPVDYPTLDPAATTYENITVFQSRSNYSQATLQGFPPNVEGTFYFPRNHVQIQGGAGAVGNQLIAWTVEAAGNGDVTINYTGNFPAPGNRVFLVE